MIDEYDDAENAAPGYTKSDLERIGRQWLEKIAASEKREKAWIDNATLAEATYLADDDNEEITEGLPSFNILHSNVETIVPAIFNSSPTPDIRPRHNNKDDVGKSVSDVLERAISAQVDDSALDAEIEGSAQDAFMAGRGVVRVRFDADEIPAQTAVVEGYEIGPDGKAVLVEQEVEIAPARLANERLKFEVVSWRDYREGPAKRWDGVPWVAYRHEVTTEEKERLEDPELADLQRDENREIDEDKDCDIWEIWCKETGNVYFISEDGKVVSITEDPLGLSGFFPQAKPVQPITATGKRCPVCPYVVYKKLAKELDEATKRINKIMQGLKVRGVIAGDAQVLDLLANAGDNELVAVPNIENLVAAGGLDRAVMWFPVEQSIAVLQQLYLQREQTKSAIYEITGISDVVRGASNAAETATAQNIKTQWGSLRIKKMQRMIERQVRDLFVIGAEIISRHFSYETLQRMTGLQIDQQMAQLLEKPLDHYRIDVESDSTIRADLTKQRTEMSEFLNGTAQFFSTMQPIVQASPQSAAPLAKMYGAFARQFNLGKSAEDAISEFVEMAEKAGQQPSQPSPEQQAAQAEMQMKMQETQAKLQLEVEKLKLQAENLRLDGQAKRQEIEIKAAETGIKARKAEIDRDTLTLKERQAEVDAVMNAAELEIEQEQKRPVEIG